MCIGVALPCFIDLDMAFCKYELIRSKRKTYTIKVTEDNRVVVRAPLNVSAAEVDKIVDEKRAWIERVFAFNKNNSLDSDDVRAYRSAYVGGQLLPVVHSQKNYIGGGAVHVTGTRGFKAAYVNTLSQAFLSSFAALQQKTGMRAATVRFRSYRSMWGCCDGGCNISFNFKLLMLPVELQRYVMVHELCHTVHHDHSAAFWAAVGGLIPDWKTLRAQLKKYSFLVKLY